MATCPRCQRSFEDDFKLCPYDGESLHGGVAVKGPPPLPPPERAALVALADRFEIQELLGYGAMAYVYHAQERSSGIDVAIKVMNHHLARTSPARARFLREIELMASIRHPNVVHVYSCGELKDGSPYIAMEYLKGESLGALLRRHVMLPTERALELAIDVASGLNAAHLAGVIHRDVKPDNIFLVGPVGDHKIAKVVDFGLARLSGASGLTQKGVIVGTPDYMSPEQATNDGTVGPRTDVYALGVVMYRLFTGFMPFMGQTDFEKLAMHLVAPPPPFSSKRDDIPADIETVVMGTLRKLPRNRYPTMQDLLDDLERLSGQREGKILGAPTEWEDVYEPQTAFARAVAETLRKKAQI